VGELMPIVGGAAPVSSDPLFYGDSAFSNAELERTGLGEGVAGWFRSRNTTSDFSVVIDKVESDPTEAGGAAKFTYVWWPFRAKAIASGSWKAALSFTWLISLAGKIARVHMFETGGTYKFRLVIDGTTVATGSNTFSLDTTYRLCTRIEVKTGSANNVWKLYVNGTEEISYTVSSSYDDGATVHDHGLGTTINAIDSYGISAGASSDSSNEAYYGTFVIAHDSTDTFDETHYTEAHGLFPDGNGFHDDFASNVNDTGGSADEGQVDDWEANGTVSDTDYWKGLNGTHEQTATFDDVTLTNTSASAVQQHDRRWSDVAAKNVPHKAYHRRNSTDKSIAFAAINDTTKRIWIVCWSTPASGSWSQSNINDSEFGGSRTGNAANLFISGIGVVTLSLGSSNTHPADPPSVLSPSPVALPLVTVAPSLRYTANPSPATMPIVTVTPSLLYTAAPSPVTVPLVVAGPTITYTIGPGAVAIPLVIPDPTVTEGGTGATLLLPDPVILTLVIPEPSVSVPTVEGEPPTFTGVPRIIPGRRKPIREVELRGEGRIYVIGRDEMHLGRRLLADGRIVIRGEAALSLAQSWQALALLTAEGDGLVTVEAALLGELVLPIDGIAAMTRALTLSGTGYLETAQGIAEAHVEIAVGGMGAIKAPGRGDIDSDDENFVLALLDIPSETVL
jgi:hypothetical protein